MKKIIFILAIFVIAMFSACCPNSCHGQTTIINYTDKDVKILPFKSDKSIHSIGIVDYEPIGDAYFTSFWNPIRLLKDRSVVNSQYIVFYVDNTKVTIKLKKTLYVCRNVIEIYCDHYVMKYQDDPSEIKEIKVNY